MFVGESCIPVSYTMHALHDMWQEYLVLDIVIIISLSVCCPSLVDLLCLHSCSLLMSCWHVDAEKRPSFQDICVCLWSMNIQLRVSFRAVELPVPCVVAIILTGVVHASNNDFVHYNWSK